MVRTVECGYLRAEVDVTDINDPKISITTINPISVSEYHSSFDVWRWDGEIAMDARALYAEVDGVIFDERMKRRREKLCGVS